MKKVFFVMLFLSVLLVSAQSPFGASKEKMDLPIFYIELMGGTIMPSMNYSSQEFDDYGSESFFAKTGGLALRCQFSPLFSVCSQFSYREQGIKVPENYNYQLTANYFNVFVPLEVEFDLAGFKKSVCPLLVLFGGPSLSRQIGGTIENDLQSISLSSNEIADWDFGIEAGLGLRIPTFSMGGRSNLTIKASYYMGLANTYPDIISGYEVSEMNQLLLAENSERMNRGIRLSLSYELSLAKREVTTFTAGGNGKTTYKRYVNVKKK